MAGNLQSYDIILSYCIVIDIITISSCEQADATGKKFLLNVYGLPSIFVEV